MRTYIGNACKLQQSLHGAILAVFTVEHREHDINMLPHHTVTLKAQQPLSTDRRDSRTAILGTVLPGAVGEHGIIPAAKEDPVTLLGDAHRENIVFFRIHVVEHRLRGTQRNLMLRTDAAKQDANA